ncbi:hypothetical protein ABIA39_006573 [Nocardia sp. GAS34]|uniref:hypothetical protein n=1 Tax=unclassified Nocardia TaxID=2637762 RepID=UPI003D24F997
MLQELGAPHPRPLLLPVKRQLKRSAGGSNTLRPSARTVAVGVLPLVLVLTCSGMSSAAVTLVSSPDQPGVTSPAQPGTTSAPPPPAPPPPVNQQDSPAVRNNEPTRPVPQWAPAAPVIVPALHLPRPVPPVAPIRPPANTIRIGEFETPTPPCIPPNVRDQINTVAANGEAGIARFWDSVGMPPSRSDRTAAATVVGSAVGGAVGVVAAGVPTAAVGAVVGGLIGGTVGGIAGAALGTLVPVPVIGTVTSGVAGTAIGAAAGAAIGAAVLGLPAAGAAAVVGGIAGGAVGAAVGVGQR